ncbi:hypothetical protein BST14_27595 [Mycobacterium arosiense ATCC BAA-1401 = DSM 45069]|uniref:Uncharacterized protein n=3 Tax=Mycobacterium TaxID=1763 RepID=A0A024K6P4_9MYCO|nr:hypothetical protein BST14_27595 [Mycobacterium arosiense ATCC BAA-1401 = DSM 45069]ORJ52511.1 hypothetical protein B5M45_31375 [Mycobacterium simiae]CDO91232.1 hypothetical protein BN973_05639 [Mycobacterium triplex]
MSSAFRWWDCKSAKRQQRIYRWPGRLAIPVRRQINEQPSPTIEGISTCAGDLPEKKETHILAPAQRKLSQEAR